MALVTLHTIQAAAVNCHHGALHINQIVLAQSFENFADDITGNFITGQRCHAILQETSIQALEHLSGSVFDDAFDKVRTNGVEEKAVDEASAVAFRSDWVVGKKSAEDGGLVLCF